MSTKKSTTLTHPFSTTCTRSPQPHDQKLCSRFARCLMEPARAPFLASFHLLKPIRDIARAQSRSVQIEAKWRRNRTSLAGQDVVAGKRTLRDRSAKRFLLDTRLDKQGPSEPTRTESSDSQPRKM